LLQTLATDPQARAHDFYFDVISLHIYFRAETVAPIVAAMDAIQGEYGLGKPIWIDETNAAPNQDPAWPV
ncbi:MAG: hypothetical protein KC418_08325, partial [Anaerolineales bacterium]|nr:hypothetical protein [Anaerolineales bacterium]